MTSALLETPVVTSSSGTWKLMEKGEEALFHGELKVPQDLAHILKDLTKEILRKGLTKKGEMLVFSKDYFADQCRSLRLTSDE